MILFENDSYSVFKLSLSKFSKAKLPINACCFSVNSFIEIISLSKLFTIVRLLISF
jgi:hypothetical protein